MLFSTIEFQEVMFRHSPCIQEELALILEEILQVQIQICQTQYKLSNSCADLLPEFMSSAAGKLSNMFMLSAKMGARTSLYCALEPQLSQSHYSGE